MKRMPKEKRIPHEGDRGSFHRTDPDYHDKIMTQLVADYNACPKSWRGTLLGGLSKRDHDELMERLGK